MRENYKAYPLVSMREELQGLPPCDSEGFYKNMMKGQIFKSEHQNRTGTYFHINKLKYGA